MPAIPSREAIDHFRNEYEFLSNFYPCWIAVRGVTAPSVEHAFQAMKATTSKDFYTVLEASTAGKAKRLGGIITLRSDWEQIKDKVMFALLLHKFRHTTPLRSMLINTGNRELIEGNTWHDYYWGVCYCGDCPSGENRLGELLMLVRDIVRPYD